MSEVGSERQPRHPRPPRERRQLIPTKRPSDRERSVVAENRVERSGEQPAPRIVTPSPNQVIYHDPAGRQPVERAQRPDDLIVGQVVKKERAGDIVEGPVTAGRQVHVGADRTQPFARRTATSGTVERVQALVERRDPQIETPSSTPSGQRPRKVAAAACHIEHGDALSYHPLSTELLEPPQRGPCAPKPAADRPEEPVDLVNDLLRRRVNRPCTRVRANGLTST